MKTAMAVLWVLLGCHTFPLLKSWERSQGVAVDEQGTYFYSWQLGLLRAKDAYSNASRLNLFAIPLELSKHGSNHIGDIDVSGGSLYAGIEDGSDYNNPY